MAEVSGSLLVQLAPVIIGLIVTFFKTFKFVHEGELAIKLRFGKAVRNPDRTPKVIYPGFVMLIPWVESLKRHHVRQQTAEYKNQNVMTKDGLIFSVSAMVMYRIRNVYNALFQIDNVDDSIADLCSGILRDVVSARDYKQLSDTEGISKELFSQLNRSAEDWGVDFLQFRMVDCAPTPETAQLVVAAKGAEMKVQAIKDAADKLKISLSAIPPSLAAVLVGVPLVATTDSINGSNSSSKKGDSGDGDGEDKEKKTIKLSLFGD